MSGEHTLYLVATPIGHLDDIGVRALHVLRSVTRVYAEDTRHSVGLLRHHGVTTPLTALHEHNERERADAIVERIREQGDAALISDAGTPSISDPGYRLVRACIEADVPVVAVPGASAVLAALVVSGLPTDRFEFAGFLPSRSNARRERYRELGARSHTLVLYESPHRIVDSLADLADVIGAGRRVAVARELTKRFETVLRGPVQEVLERVRADRNQQRGEFVIVVGGTGQVGADDATGEPDGSSLPGDTGALSTDALILALAPHLPPRTVARVVADLKRLPKRDVYARAMSLAGRG